MALPILDMTLSMIASIIGIAIGATTALLFWVTYYYERKIRTLWRAIGFFLVACSFAFFLLDTLVSGFMTWALLLLPVAFAAILCGVYVEPILTHLRTIATWKERTSADIRWKPKLGYRAVIIPIVAVLTVLSLIVGGITALRTISLFLTSLCIGATILLQFLRYRWEREEPDARRQNLYPLIAYIFLFGGVFFLLFNVPLLSSLSMILGYIFLAFWSWLFIRVRSFLRKSVVLLVFLGVVWSLLLSFFTLFIVVGLRILLR